MTDADTRSLGERLFGGYVPKLESVVDDLVMGDVWERDELAPRDRSLVTIAALMTLGSTQQLPGHVRRGLENGLSVDEVKEVLVHLAFYIGFPRTINAARAIREVLETAEPEAAGPEAAGPPSAR
ncbi:carboxymuconolactone decarboxylase family protein [Cnuibacter physcomitrellae]|uniref:carboxymuconolactone decarboxylase family protein n=1 Tax=Cnuibacter physcomitrellae TaxID=1619308 RepID=UPI0021758082|nr:carboxymuconolactone decarboxylase family protein [Cnuibacter physcomitrellae]MCS5498283.1 carboxymuconolactone decarboxylase family protein [Cnuibacter physcomitrellae]